MISRQLTKKVEIQPDENMSNSNNVIELEYYLLESEISDCEELDGKRIYGIEIVKKVSASAVEKETVTNLCCCKDNAESILNKLADNSVTPVGMPFVLDDMLGV